MSLPNEKFLIPLVIKFPFFMYSDGKKIHLLEKIIQTQDDELLSSLEVILGQYEEKKSQRSAFSLQGLLTEDDVIELNSIIEKGCENIDADGWN